MNRTPKLYLNDLPRYGLGIVFLWFGIDKFLIHEFYLSWFSSTPRVSSILPFDDPSLSIYFIGVIELILASLLFAGVWVRWVSLTVILFLIAILTTAQYPSSFPQDIGLIGIALLLALTNVSWQKAKTKKFLNFLWIVRYSMVAVLILWAADHIINIDIHVGWMQLASPLGEVFSGATIRMLLVLVALTEISLAGMMASGKITITKYSLIAVTVFFVFARVFLAPPLSNHQTIGLAIVSGWLAYVAISKKQV